jgi:hypothetical protein
MSALEDLFKQFLPYRPAQIAAALTLPATAGCWALPHLLSPLIPKASQAEVVLTQLVCALLALNVGSIATLVLSLRHAQLEVAKREVASNGPHDQTTTSLGTPQYEVSEPDFTNDMFVILLFLAENEDRTSDEVAAFLGVGDPLALHLLEELGTRKLIADKHIPGSPWAGSKYRREWFCTPAGRRHLAQKQVLK